MTMTSTPGQTIVLWGTRGGVGTTVAATQLAFQHPRHVILIDLGGDLDITLGLRKSKHGVRDLEQADSRTTDEILSAAAVQVAPRVVLVPHGGRETPRQLGDGPLADLAEWIRHHEGVVIVDAGTGPPPTALAEVADESLVVTRLSSVDAQRLRALKVPPTALIVVEHPDAWLTKDDIVNAASAGIYATMPHDSDIANAIDTGTFLQRQPQLRELSAMPTSANRSGSIGPKSPTGPPSSGTGVRSSTGSRTGSNPPGATASTSGPISGRRSTTTGSGPNHWATRCVSTRELSTATSASNTSCSIHGDPIAETNRSVPGSPNSIPASDRRRLRTRLAVPRRRRPVARELEHRKRRTARRRHPYRS